GGGIPRAHLARAQEGEPLRSRRLAEEAMQDRARDVVRKVRDDLVGRLDEPRQLPVESLAFDQAQPARLDRLDEAVAEERREAAIELDGGDLGARVEQARGEQ